MMLKLATISAMVASGLLVGAVDSARAQVLNDPLVNGPPLTV
jgi:hypothetical protein